MSGYNGSTDVNGIARNPLSRPENLPGPTITSVIDDRTSAVSRNPLSGFVIQDGCIPEAFSPIIHIMLTLQTINQQAISLLLNPRCEARKVLTSVKSFLFGPYAIGGALQRTSTYLIMSHDSNETTLTLKDDRICLSAPKEGRSGHYQRITGLFNGLFSNTGAKMGYSFFYSEAAQVSSCTRNAKPSFRSTPGGGHSPPPGRG